MAGDNKTLSALKMLEGRVCDVRDMTQLLELTLSQNLDSVGPELEEIINKGAPVTKGYHVKMLTDEQQNAIRYAVLHLVDLGNGLHKAFYEALEGREAANG